MFGERSNNIVGVAVITSAVAALLVAVFGCGTSSTASVSKQKPKAVVPMIENCQVFPADNAWNTDISGYPVHPNSANFIASIGANEPLHEDFGTMYQGIPSGIPYVIVHKGQPKAPVTFDYADESDPGPYPIPDNAPIEGGPEAEGDRHVLVVDVDDCRLYELFHAFKTGNGWHAGSGAIFDLNSNQLRPLGWTSCDAAGLPVFPGLVRYDEVVEKGEISHALRFTVRRSQRGYVLPATHFASSSKDPNLPPMGLRLRLRADFDVSGMPREAQVILTALKKYGLIVADNGGDWFISGAPDPRWNDDAIRAIRKVKGSDFEAVATGPIHTG